MKLNDRAALVASMFLLVSSPLLAQAPVDDAEAPKDETHDWYKVLFVGKGDAQFGITYTSAAGSSEMSVEGTDIDETNRSSRVLAFGAEYGVSDRMSFFAGGSNLMGSSSQRTLKEGAGEDEGDKTETNSKGFSEPVIGIRYISNQNVKADSAVVLGTVSFSPDMGDSKSASEEKDGNALRGGTKFGFGVSVIRDIGQGNLMAGVDLDYVGETVDKDLEDDTESKSDGVDIMSYNFGGTLFINENVFAGVSYSTTGSYSFDVDAEYEDDDFTLKMKSETAFTMSAGYVTEKYGVRAGYTSSKGEAEAEFDQGSLDIVGQTRSFDLSVLTYIDK